MNLAIRAAFDHAEEAVGVEAVGSAAFEAGHDTRAMIEILAAITAKANAIASEVITRWEAPQERKQELYEHYAALKENMLNDMLRKLESGGDANA